MELATAGRSYQEIAEQVGYGNRGTAFRAVSDALERQAVQSVDSYRRVELDRLEALQHAIWGRAMAGDPEAVLAARKIILARCRLLGLFPSRRQPDKRGHARSVVLTDAERRTWEQRGGADR